MLRVVDLEALHLRALFVDASPFFNPRAVVKIALGDGSSLVVYHSCFSELAILPRMPSQSVRSCICEAELNTSATFLTMGGLGGFGVLALREAVVGNVKVLSTMSRVGRPTERTKVGALISEQWRAAIPCTVVSTFADGSASRGVWSTMGVG